MVYAQNLLDMTVSRLIRCDRRSFRIYKLGFAGFARILLIGTSNCKNNNDINHIFTTENTGLISDP